jgi:hypothetical protein
MTLSYKRTRQASDLKNGLGGPFRKFNPVLNNIIHTIIHISLVDVGCYTPVT